MKSFSCSSINPRSINPRTVLFNTLLAASVSLALLPTHAKADEWNKKTIITIGEPMQVSKDLLQPGTYVFKLVDTIADRHVVQISNADQTHVIDTIIAIPEYRTNPDGRQFRFYETPSGAAKALRAWYYPGDNFGQGFPYPKHLVMLQTSLALAEPQPVPQPEPVPQAQAEVTPEPAPAPVVEDTTQMAQVSPPPQPTPAPAPDQTPAPATLPTTASNFPLMALSGVLSIGLFALLRLKRAFGRS